MALVKSEHRYARIACSKVNRLLPIIRGREVGDSLELLRALPNRAARMVEAVVQTAAANAAEAGVRNVERLKIVEAIANGGPMFKRIRPRARGMAYMERHRTSHIRIGNRCSRIIRQIDCSDVAAVELTADSYRLSV